MTKRRLPLIYARIPMAKISFLRFILEGYDGLACLSTVDRLSGLVRISHHSSARETLIGLLDSLSGAFIDELPKTDQGHR